MHKCSVFLILKYCFVSIPGRDVQKERPGARAARPPVSDLRLSPNQFKSYRGASSGGLAQLQWCLPLEKPERHLPVVWQSTQSFYLHDTGSILLEKSTQQLSSTACNVLIMDIIGKAVLSSIYNLSGVQWWWKGHGKGGGLLYWSRLIRGDHGWGTGAKWVLGNLRWKRTICKWQKVHRTLFVLQDSKQSQKMVQKLSMGQYPYVRD